MYELARYARVFNVPVANLLQVVMIRDKDDFESNLILENKAGKISMDQVPTGNPFVVLTKIEERL
jgi:hypothetical protein